MRAVGRRHIVIDDGERLLRRAHLAAGEAQPFERLRARHFVNEMTIDIEKTGAVFLTIDHMIFEDFIVERLRSGHGCLYHRWRAAATLWSAPKVNLF